MLTIVRRRSWPHGAVSACERPGLPTESIAHGREVGPHGNPCACLRHRLRATPSVPAETVLQDGWRAFLLFWAVSQSVGSGRDLDDLGIGVLARRDCASSLFGYPNDGRRPEHPLYSQGLAEAGS